MLLRRGLGEVEAGDLEAVEEEAGATRVDVVRRDALEDEADGGLDGGAVLGKREVEGGLFIATLAEVDGRGSGGVVVVAEFFSAQAGAAAAVAVGVDMAALVSLRCFDDGWLHGVSPPLGEKCAKYSKEKT